MHLCWNKVKIHRNFTIAHVYRSVYSWFLFKSCHIDNKIWYTQCRKVELVRIGKRLWCKIKKKIIGNVHKKILLKTNLKSINILQPSSPCALNALNGIAQRSTLNAFHILLQLNNWKWTLSPFRIEQILLEIYITTIPTQFSICPEF